MYAGDVKEGKFYIVNPSHFKPPYLVKCIKANFDTNHNQYTAQFEVLTAQYKNNKTNIGTIQNLNQNEIQNYLQEATESQINQLIMKEFRLKSMVDFVLNYPKMDDHGNGQKTTKAIYDQLILLVGYAKFLKQPLELWMFIPCDEEGGVLEEPKNYLDWKTRTLGTDLTEQEIHLMAPHCIEYQKAKERCLFEGFEITEKAYDGEIMLYRFGYSGCTQFGSGTTDYDSSGQYFGGCHVIEDLVKHNVSLTQTAIKQLGL